MGPRRRYYASNPCFRASSVSLNLLPVVLVFCLLFSPAEAADVDILLELSQLVIHPYLESWNVSDTANYCNWTGITCHTPGGNVKWLDIGANYSIPLLRGILPSSIANFVEIEILRLENNNLIGEVPIQLWTHPTLQYAIFSGTGVTIRFPPRLGSNMKFVGISDTLFNGTMPEMQWNTTIIVDFAATGLHCPLPQGLVDYVNAGNDPQLLKLRLTLTNVEVDLQNRICGQLLTNVTNFEIFPLVNDPFVPPGRTPLRSVDYGNFTLEFYGDRVLIYASYESRNQRVVYREEYAAILVYPLTQRLLEPRGWYCRAATIASLGTMVWRTPTLLVANLTMAYNGGTIPSEFIFDFAPANKVNDASQIIKFSVNYKNQGVNWLSPTTLGGINSSVIFSLGIHFKGAHSPANGPQPTLCDRKYNLFEHCQSARSNFSLAVYALANPPYSQVRYTTSTIDFDYSYGVIGRSDNNSLDFANIEVTVSKFFSGIGTIEALTQHQNMNQTHRLVPLVGPENRQFVSLVARMVVPWFTDDFSYDPDFSLHLLFDPGEDQPPAVTDIDSAAFSAGAIAGIVVAVIVAVALVALFPTVVFPYLKRRNRTSADSAFDDEHAHLEATSNQEAESKKWTRTAPRQARS